MLCATCVHYPHVLVGPRGSTFALSYIADTFASCLTHPFPSEGDIVCDDSSNLYVNPMDGSGGGGTGAPANDFCVRKSASGDGSVLCGKGSQGNPSPSGSRASLGGGSAGGIVGGSRGLDASRTSLPQPLEEPPAHHTAAVSIDEGKPKHRKARFQQVSLTDRTTPDTLPRAAGHVYHTLPRVPTVALLPNFILILFKSQIYILRVLLSHKYMIDIPVSKYILIHTLACLSTNEQFLEQYLPR